MVVNTKIDFNIDAQEFSLLKTYELRKIHEIHTLSICINNVKVYYEEWNIELMGDIVIF